MRLEFAHRIIVASWLVVATAVSLVGCGDEGTEVDYSIVNSSTRLAPDAGGLLDEPSEPPARCLDIEAGAIDFGEVSLGSYAHSVVRVVNCGDVDLRVVRIEFINERGAEFDWDLPPHLEQGALEISLAPEQAFSLDVTTLLEQLGGFGGELVVVADDGTTDSVSLTGVAVPDRCPVAVPLASVDGGPKSATITTTQEAVVKLDGEESYDPGGWITRYEWSLVEQPEGSQGIRLLPSSEVIDPSIMLGAAGTYRLELVVVDNSANTNCERAFVEITATP